jgi:tRNA(Ile)-lysidine synthase
LEGRPPVSRVDPARCYNHPEMGKLYDQVAALIRKESLLCKEQALVLGVSGGADSLCALDCLHHLGYKVIVAHLDHKLREESAQEAAFVRKTAEDYGLPYIEGKADVAALAGGGTSIEEAARMARYRFLVNAARESNVEAIATGHTSDDQVETVLMHFLRGSGPSGLRGMLPSIEMDDWTGIPDAEGLRLIRPLLGVSRVATNEHCVDIGLTPRIDVSNLDPAYYRNRLRHHLLPILETYNPGVRQILLRTGKVMAAEAEFMHGEVEKRWSSVVRKAGPAVLLLLRESFLKQPLAIQRSLLRAAISTLREGLRDIGFDQIERGIHFIEHGEAGKQWHVGANLVLTSMYDEVALAPDGARLPFRDYPQCQTCEVQILDPPTLHPLRDGWHLQVDLRPTAKELPEDLFKTEGRGVEAFTTSELVGSLRLRCPKEGDRLQPLGMAGQMKVSDLLVNRHIPQAARSFWPIVADGEQILWVVGLRRSSAARLEPETRKVVLMQLIPPEEGEHD